MQLTLSKKTIEQIYKLDIQKKGSAPQILDYVRALNDLAFKYSEVNGIITHRELLELFRRSKARALIGQHPSLNDNTHFISMLHSTEFDTWEKHLQFHGAYAEMLAIEQNAAAYEKHLSAFGSTALTVIPQTTAVN